MVARRTSFRVQSCKCSMGMPCRKDILWRGGVTIALPWRGTPLRKASLRQAPSPGPPIGHPAARRAEKSAPAFSFYLNARKTARKPPITRRLVSASNALRSWIRSSSS